MPRPIIKNNVATAIKTEMNLFFVNDSSISTAGFSKIISIRLIESRNSIGLTGSHNTMIIRIGISHLRFFITVAIYLTMINSSIILSLID